MDKINRAECAGETRFSSIGAKLEPTATELLVGYGFRGWISGYQSGDVACWERVWRLYSNMLGPKSARAVVGSLASWAQTVNCSARRNVEVAPLEACEFCRDECLAISMIAASQHQTCPAMRACAFALVDSALLDEVLHYADTYALMLRSQDRIVSPNWIVNANAYCDPHSSYPH